MARFTFDSRRIEAQPGDTFASALHRAGERVLSRSMKYHRPRGLYCCVGSCASCFVDVDGVPNVPACTTPARDGARLRSQNTLGGAKRDLLGVVDKVYRKGLDPHGMFTRPRVLNSVFLKTVRYMSGVGKVPDAGTPLQVLPRRHAVEVDTLVVGGGRHGLQAAREAAGRTLLVEEQPELGGTARHDPSETGTRTLVDEAPGWRDVECWTDALAFGFYGDTVGVCRGDDLWEVRAKRFVVAPGRHDDWPLFDNNDLPGVLSLRGAQRLLWQHGVRPGRRVVAHGRLPDAFAAALVEAGAEVVGEGEVQAAKGGSGVERALVDDRWLACDTVVCDLPPTPRIELLQQAGCELRFRGSVLTAAADAAGATSRADVEARFTEAA